MPHRRSVDPELPALLSIDMARAAGLTSDQVRQRVRSGEWQRLSRGWYVRTASLDEPDERATGRRIHQLAAVAAALAHPGHVVCGPSAAVLQAMPLLRVPACVHLNVRSDGWTGMRGGIRFHEWLMAPEHVAIAPIALTTAARTWADVGRVDGTPSAVIVGDHLLHRGEVTANELAEVIDQMRASQHVGRTSRALRLLDGRRESPLESASACYFDRHRVAMPEWQVDLCDDDGLIGRVDCAWDDARVVGEADGRLKYATADDLYREKRREDRIRATGRLVIRWGWSDLRDPRLAQRIRAALSRPTPTVTWTAVR